MWNSRELPGIASARSCSPTLGEHSAGRRSLEELTLLYHVIAETMDQKLRVLRVVAQMLPPAEAGGTGNVDLFDQLMESEA